MPKHSEQKVIVDENGSVGSITQIVRFGIPTILIVAVVAIAVVVVSGYDLRTLLVRSFDSGLGVEAPTSIDRTQFADLLVEGCNLLDDGQTEEAEKSFDQAHKLEPQSAEPWYWKAKAAMAIPNRQTALAYVDDALRLAPNHHHSLVLKIQLLLSQGDISPAEELASQSDGISKDLDSWLKCLNENNIFSLTFVPVSELDEKCQPPTYKCEEIRRRFP